MKCEICGKEFNPVGGHPYKCHNISNKEYYDKYLKKENEGVCLECGKDTKFISISKGYQKFCSSKCSNNSNIVKKKKEKTCLKKYGTTTPLKNKEVIKKSKQTKKEKYGDENYNNRKKYKETCLNKYGVECNLASNNPKLNGISTNLKKYGVENPFQSKEIQRKIKKTNLKKYGSENVFQCQEIKEKIKETNLKNLGVEYPTQSKEVLKIREENNLKKYGVKLPSQLQEVKDKIKNTTLERYGKESYFQTKEKQEKSKKTCLEKYGVEYASQAKDIKEKVKNTNLKKYGIPWYCMSKKCKNALNGNNSKPNQIFEKKLKESEIFNYEREFILNEYNYDFKVNDYLIEINPSATHNVNWSPWNKNKGIDKNYHKNKTEVAEKNKYHCIHIWDWDNIDKIIFLLKDREKIYARKLIIKEVSKKEADIFLNKYHIQSTCNGQKIILGLYTKENELISLMSFGKSRYNQNYEWELLRYCTIKNVVGGANKLFTYFIKKYNPASIISYCDRSKFSGNVYNSLGFIKLKENPPSCHWSKGKIQITDNLLRQRGFDQLFGTNYGKGTNNQELMLKEKFVQVYDCGQDTYIWE